MASIRCVRPVLTTPASSSALMSSVSARCSKRRYQLLECHQRGADLDGGRDHVVGTLAHVHVIVRMDREVVIGAASRAITSLAFMLDDVPEPVWNTSTGKCASTRPEETRGLH